MANTLGGQGGSTLVINCFKMYFLLQKKNRNN